MAEGVFDDILEKVFLRLGVKDIIQCKSVCKSWYSVISSSTFVNSHLKHNNTVGRTRIIIQEDWKINQLVGSSNGLVCILNPNVPKLCVLNPCTRERKIVRHRPYFHCYDPKPDLYGFGYDSSSGDYKVILGKYMDNSTHFYLLSLKSNDGKSISSEGRLRCVLGRGSAGILCNGALHWLMRDQNLNPVILSFDLSKEEFKKIPTPADERCKFTYHIQLGIIEDCLCIYNDKKRDYPIWVMKNYNDKQSWKLLPPLFQWDDQDIIQDVKVLKPESYNQATTFFYHNLCLYETLRYISALVFVQSLVSPHFHFNKKQKRERRRRFMKIKEDPPIRLKKATV